MLGLDMESYRALDGERRERFLAWLDNNVHVLALPSCRYVTRVVVESEDGRRVRVTGHHPDGAVAHVGPTTPGLAATAFEVDAISIEQTIDVDEPFPVDCMRPL